MLQTNLSKQLAQKIYQSLYGTIKGLLEEDLISHELLERLVANFNQVMGSEIQAKESIKKIEFLLVALLEEIKVNYVKGLSAEDVEEILEQTRVLRKRNFS